MPKNLDLSTLVLAKGKHNGNDDEVCIMEAVAYIAGEPHSDHPECASPALTNMGIGLNDNLPDDRRQELVPLIPLIVGTRDDGLEKVRSYMAVDWLIRTYTPAWLELAGLSAEATALRDLRRIVDLAAVEAAGPAIAEANSKASAAYSAAYSAADSAAYSAAYSAADSAAYSAADSAAYSAADSAAYSAARSAARSAAYSAADSALAPTVSELQTSAIALFAAMIRPTELAA